MQMPKESVPSKKKARIAQQSAHDTDSARAGKGKKEVPQKSFWY